MSIRLFTFKIIAHMIITYIHKAKIVSLVDAYRHGNNNSIFPDLNLLGVTQH